MKSIIKVHADQDDIDMTFENDELNNYNFVNLGIEGKWYLVGVEDLVMVAKMFDEFRGRYK